MSNEILEKIKDEYAKEHGWEDFESLLNEGFGLPIGVEQTHFDAVSERYSTALTAEQKAENEKMKADIKELRQASLHHLDCSVNDKPLTECLSAGMELRGAIVKTAHYENPTT